MNKTLISLAGMGCLTLIIAGCSSLAQERPVVPDEVQSPQIAPGETKAAMGAGETLPAEETPAEEPERAAVKPASLPDIPQPVNELANGEYRWSQLLARDAIAPIYDPQFAPADQAPYDDNELVIGLEINGEAKAYAIGPLNSREMVNDELGGIPILVTW